METNLMKEQKETQVIVKKNSVGSMLVIMTFFIILAGACGYLGWQNESLKKDVMNLKNDIIKSRYVYVYSLDEVLIKSGKVEEKRKFEEDVMKLNEEVLLAEEKIKSIKEANVKEDFSDMYLKNLRMKRDDMVENYQKSITKLTNDINQALVKIAQEKDVNVVYQKNVIAVNTPYVVDLTDEVIEKIKE